MNSVERVKQLCKDRNIAISRLERDLGFSNGYIGQLRKGVFPDDRLFAIANYFNVAPYFLLTGKEQKNKPSLELGEPIGDITGVPIIASVKAGYNGLAIEDNTGEYVHIPSVMLRGYPSSECRAMHIRGDSMYPNMQDGDIVIVHIQQEAENGKVAVCIVNGDEGTIKRFFRYPNRVELWPDNQQIPRMVLRGEQLESFHIYGQAIALIRQDL